MFLGQTSPHGNCTGGFFCSGGSIAQSPIAQSYGDVCPEGNYCPEGTGTPIPCPAGTYLPTPGGVVVGDCLPCPGGKYCETTGLSNYTGKLLCK